MQKKLTIWVAAQELEDAYCAMAADDGREAEAKDWSEALVGDVADEPR